MLKAAATAAGAATILGLGLAQWTSLPRAPAAELGQGGRVVTNIPSPAPSVFRPASDKGGVDTTVIEADHGGQFVTTMEIAGRSFPALIDTGASYVALTNDDAASLGFHLADADFKYTMHTANGTTRAAGIVIPHIRIGNVEARNVTAVVSQPGALTGQNLVGMSFLQKLSGFETASSRLILKQ